VFHSKGKTLLWLAALVTLLSLGLASKPLRLNARSISSKQTVGLALNEVDTGTIFIKKETDPPGGTGFDFLHDFGIGLPGFTLGDGGWLEFNVPVIAFSYTITETLPIGWELTGVVCETDDENDTSSWSGNTLTIDLDAGETITCTFTNGVPPPPPEPIGGIVVPVNRLELLAPWLDLVALASLAALTVVVVRRRRG